MLKLDFRNFTELLLLQSAQHWHCHSLSARRCRCGHGGGDHFDQVTAAKAPSRRVPSPSDCMQLWLCIVLRSLVLLSSLPISAAVHSNIRFLFVGQPGENVSLFLLALQSSLGDSGDESVLGLGKNVSVSGLKFFEIDCVFVSS